MDLNNLKKMFKDNGITENMLIETEMQNGEKILSISFAGEDKDESEEYIASIIPGYNGNITTIHVSKDLAIPAHPENKLVEALKSINELNNNSGGIVYVIDFEDNTLNASISSLFATNPPSAEELYNITMFVIGEALKNFNKF